MTFLGGPITQGFFSKIGKTCCYFLFRADPAAAKSATHLTRSATTEISHLQKFA